MRTAITIWSLWISTAAKAQSMQWLTYEADTSYTLLSEYRKLSPRYPILQLPEAVAKNNLRYERMVYAETKDYPLNAYLIAPASPKNINGIVLVLIHGGGWRSGTPELLMPLAERMAIRGFTCVLPQYRLSTHALYPAAVLDIKACIRWVQEKAGEWNCSATKIAVAGHSAGGQIAALIGATNRKKLFDDAAITVQAVIDMDGILAFIHPESGEGDDSKGPSAATRWFGASKIARPDLWQEASPLHYVGSHCPPFLFINSSVVRMQAGQKDFCAALSSAGIPFKVITLEDAPHSFVLFQPWLERTVMVIDEFLRQLFFKR